jgi:hypothetical protein
MAALSVTAPTVDAMQDSDSVDPDDAALHRAFASLVEHIPDPAKKDAVIDFLMTARPLAEWSKEELDKLLEVCTFVVSRLRMGQELDQLIGPDAPTDQTEDEGR